MGSLLQRGLCVSLLIFVAGSAATRTASGAAVQTASGAAVQAASGAVAHASSRVVAQDIQGAWRAETYVLANGVSHTVDGMIFFTATDWTVLFFVLDQEGVGRRGSGEGGSYALEGDRLTFRHRYNLSAGEEMEGLPASELRMQIRDAADEAVEPCTIELSEERLTIHFPSGNRMMFSRSS